MQLNQPIIKVGNKQTATCPHPSQHAAPASSRQTWLQPSWLQGVFVPSVSLEREILLSPASLQSWSEKGVLQRRHAGREKAHRVARQKHIEVFNKSHGSPLVVKYCFSFPEMLNSLLRAEGCRPHLNLCRNTTARLAAACQTLSSPPQGGKAISWQ